MTIRIIETASNIAARQPGVSQLPAGNYYYDSVYGLVVDYIASDAPEELIATVLYACSYDGGSFTVRKEAPGDFTNVSDFAGWPSCCMQEE